MCRTIRPKFEPMIRFPSWYLPILLKKFTTNFTLIVGRQQNFFVIIKKKPFVWLMYQEKARQSKLLSTMHMFVDLTESIIYSALCFITYSSLWKKIFMNFLHFGLLSLGKNETRHKNGQIVYLFEVTGNQCSQFDPILPK